MTETDRTNLLHELNSRHEEVLGELDALSQSIERVLATMRPPSGEAAAPATVGGPGAPTC
jgi:phage baseplate assembly protein W